jgi:hypothetical protein
LSEVRQALIDLLEEIATASDVSTLLPIGRVLSNLTKVPSLCPLVRRVAADGHRAQTLDEFQ